MRLIPINKSRVFFRFLIDGSSIVFWEAHPTRFGIEAILRKPGRKLISWLIRFTSKFHDRAGCGAARVEMKRLKCMLVTALLRSHFRLLYGPPLLYRSKMEPVFSRIFSLALSSISFRPINAPSNRFVETAKHVVNLRINFAFKF